jgi:DNA-binding winged helix-turn-helix (wHTH) protein
MTYRFGDFELDERARELRLQGAEIPLQPRVFDLLALLVRNRERVMSKDELLSELWPNVIVGEGSLQRAVSLARSALRQGGLADAIRNYSRQGYRFSIDPGAAADDGAPSADRRDAASAAYQRGEWDTAIDAYRRADAESPLDAIDLEHFADAYQCAGRATDSEAVLERAAAAFVEKGDVRGAARVELRLAEGAFEAARIPVAHGWLARARRHLHGCAEGWEHGFEAYVAARVAIATGDPETAVRSGRRGLDIGERIASEEIQALARIYLGYGEIALGNVQAGIAHVDEAAAIALAGNVAPRVGGIIYCGLIWLCCNRGDWQRATQWGESFDRWCEREGMTRFTGLCQLHRAEVMSITGDATEAEHEIRIACDQLSAYSPFAVGDGFRILGDLHRLRGDLERADESFRRAHDLGWDPQPGMALLQAERGDHNGAIRGLLHALNDHNWALRQRRGLLLAVMVIIAARSGDRDRAADAMAEIDRHPQLWASEYNTGAIASARAELAILDRHFGAAVAAMREAIRGWHAARAGLNVAMCRLRLAELLGQEGDTAAALLELDAAQASFDALNAPVRAAACLRLRRSLAASSTV